jgi:hypothetical protein
LMKTIKLPMAKQATSWQELKEIWKAEGQEIQKKTLALGVDWNTEFDMLSVDPREILDKTTLGPATKRQLLQTIAWFYDPLSLFSPVSAIAKILFQECWCRGMQWEEIPPHDIGDRWNAWTTSLPLLADRHSSLDRNIKRSRHSDTCFLWRVWKGLWSGLVRPIICTWRRYSQTSLQ